MRSVRASVLVLLAAGSAIGWQSPLRSDSVAVAGFWDTEVLVDSGAVTAFDVTSDTAGGIWVAIAYPDKAVGLYYSDDFGSTWRGHWAMRADSTVRQVRLLAGQGDSSFMYLFMLEAGNDGDLWLARIRSDSAGSDLTPVAVGPDTVDDFSVTLDRDPHYYVYCLYANEHRTGRTGTFTRSLDYGVSWESGTDWWNAWDPCISYTSGSTIHCVWRYALNGGEVHYSYNHHYGMSGFWSAYRVVSSGADQCFDPVVAQTDSSLESQAAIWVFYTVGRRDTAVLDLQYSVSWDGGQSWAPGQPFGDPIRDEQQPMLAADRTGPNGYASLCYRYGSRQFGDSGAVYWTCANAYNLDYWLKPVKVSRHPVAGLGPKLVYAPHSPMRLPGVLYSQQTEAGPWGVWFAAPWMNAGGQATGNAEGEVEVEPNPAVGAVRLSANVTMPGSYSVAVYDAAGRLVVNLFRGRLEPGPQFWTWDRRSLARRVPAGTYFVRLVGPGLSTGRRVVLL
ncbi:MAG: T9SS type A sorting domain-containing protein [candidate division WOR-3 bacterium]|nr:T9SS type A sorting domain-containing protein [candidate division WOR-3 bacterium]